MLRTALLGSVSPSRPIHGTHTIAFRKPRSAANTVFSTQALLENLAQHGTQTLNAAEVAREHALARTADPYYLMEWTLFHFSVVPFSVILYNLGLLALFKRRKTRIPKEEIVHQHYYGVDVSSSVFLMRPAVQSAVQFAERAHRGQKRKTGDPYITHCIHTALILENLFEASMDDSRCETAMICAVLHDVLDVESVTYEDVRDAFGNQVATSVRQISELSSMIQLIRRHRRQNNDGRTMDDDERNVEDYKLRSAILKRCEDPLVLAVKLADRLHNLRTIYILAPDKQRAIAQETQKIFCTLAERLGFFSLKAEMEDLCFCVLQPNEFYDVYRQVQLLWKSEKTKQSSSKSKMVSPDSDGTIVTEDISQKQCRELLQLVIPFTSNRCTHQDPGTTVGFGLDFLHKRAKQLLLEINMLSFSAGLDINVVSRVKSLYSTYEKMKKKGISIDQVYDVLAVRVIVTEDGDPEIAREVCYRTLSLVQHLWKPIPAELDDYIVLPKESGYQSLHVSVTGPGRVPFEVQIRTASMDVRAEYGHAAHWRYKEESDISTAACDSITLRDSIWGAEKAIIGRPVVRIRDGRWRDGIVIRTENAGLAIVVAVSISDRISHSYGSYTFAVQKSYEELVRYVEERHWSAPGSGNFHVVVERYVLCSDHAYHLIDGYGYKHPTVVRPVSVFDSNTSLATHLQTLDSGTQGNTVEFSDSDFRMKGQVSHLRSMLGYCDDLDIERESTSVHVMIWPEGKIQSFPLGTTAADVLASRNRLHQNDRDGNTDQLVSVNDRLVRSDIQLKDGDYIVLQGAIIQT